MTPRPAAALRMKPPTEKVVQAQIVALFRMAGCKVASTSQYRASRVTPGLPDLLVFAPGYFFFFEVKTYRAAGFDLFDRSTWVPLPLRPEQAEFRRQCWNSGVVYHWGGLPEAEAALIVSGLAERVNGVFRLTPRRAA